MQPKKILVAFDGSFHAESALEFAIKIASNEKDLLVGIFIQDLSYPYLSTNFGIEPQPFEYSYDIMNQMMSEDLNEIDKNINHFTERCIAAGVNYKVHLDKGVPADELIQESGFADVIIAGHKMYFSSFEDEDSSGIINELLAQAHCPVWIIPENLTDIKEIVFAYDGYEASAWAIKQFTYLFGEQFSDRKFTLLFIKSNENTEPENKKLILEYARLHYPEISFIKQSGKVEEEIPYFVKTSSEAALVIGMQNKNFITRLFEPDHAKELFQNSTLPVFIAHR